MKRTVSLLLLFALTGMSTIAFGQSDGDSGAACALVGAMRVVYLVILAVALAIGVGLIILIVKWIRKDAIARGMPNAESIKWWGLLGLLGLIIYLLQRPALRI